MRKSRKLALVASVCVAMLALAITGTVGVLNVSATGGLSSDVDVILIDPPPGETMVLFTPDGLAPASLPVEAVAFVTAADMYTVDTVDFVVNPDPLDGTSAEADDVTAGQLDDGEWIGVVDLATADLSLPVVIAALARISGGYARVPVTAYDEFGWVEVTVDLRDGSTIDTNGNNKPDADGLAANPSGTFFGTNASGGQVISFWRPLDTSRATPVLSQLLDTADGSVFVDVTAPTLDELGAPFINMYDDGRLLVTLAALPTHLLDGPLGVDPLGEFDLTEARASGDPLPPPVNIFALVNILLRDSVGAPTEWFALEQIPAGAPPISLSMDGPGVAAQLAALLTADPLAEVYGYTYDTTFAQDGSGDLTDDGDMNGWLQLAEPASFTLGRFLIDADDDTIAATFALASVIFGSNGAPLALALASPSAPAITIIPPNPFYIEVDVVYNDPGATAFDIPDGHITDLIVRDLSNVDTSTIGTFQVTYDVTDSDENAAPQAVRTVNVVAVGSLVPEITILGDNPVTIEVDTEYVDAGATATDIPDGDITAAIEAVSNVDTTTIGQYQVTYDVTDSDGNAIQAVRTVNVVAAGGSSSGTCFIATAAYGTPLANDINVLRAVRDSYMLNNAVGAAFVDTYYRLSPPVADAVANNALLKAAVRTLLTPVVIVSSFVLAMPGASLLLLLGFAALAVSRIRRRMTRV